MHVNGVLRVQTDIRAGTRTDKTQHFQDKVTKVESILAADVSSKAEGASGGSTVGTIDAEGNQGHVAGDAKVRDEVEEVGKGGASGTQVGPGKVQGSWASLLKQ